MSDDRAVAILKCADVARTIAWYTGLGFRLRAQSPDDGAPTWCEVGRDGLTLQFLAGDPAWWPGPPCFTGTIYVHPDSVDAVVDVARGHAEPAWGPEIREWGTREVGFEDPDGYVITFTEPA